MARLREIGRLGQSIWYDTAGRVLLDHDELRALLEAGVTGVVSSPTTREQTLEGVRRTADRLRPAYGATGGVEGYLSLGGPAPDSDTAGTVAEAQRLFAAIDRPNVMIEVPTTPAGLPAIAALISQGINVNATRICSPAQYEAAAGAYLDGLERLVAAGGDPAGVASVASFSLSPVDAVIDRALVRYGSAAEHLRGTIATAGATVAYARFRKIVSASRWQRLAKRGARVQRLLWASTGAANPRYRDGLYVDYLIGPDTINAVPPATLGALLDGAHGVARPALEANLPDAQARLRSLADLGLDLEEFARSLQRDGAAALGTSYDPPTSDIAGQRSMVAALAASA